MASGVMGLGKAVIARFISVLSLGGGTDDEGGPVGKRENAQIVKNLKDMH